MRGKPTVYREDEAEQRTRLHNWKATQTWVRSSEWIIGIGLALYYGVMLTHWLFSFPSNRAKSESSIGIIFASLFILSTVFRVLDFFQSLLTEFRNRSKEANRRLSALKVQIEALKKNRV